MTKDMIEELRQLGCFGDAKVKLLEGETIPKPKATNAVFFRDFFLCGLRFSAMRFLHQVLEAFEVQLHHLTHNGIVTLSKFCWACLSYGMEPNVGTFYEYYELQCQPKRVGEDQLLAQYGSCAFMPLRAQKGKKLEISFAQKNKWSKD